ncbi:hypothetical protein V2J09_009211 [Rumex salicifolius]
MNDYAKLRKRQEEWRAEQLHSVELPLTTLAQEEDHENTFGLAQESGFEQGLPSRTIAKDPTLAPVNIVDGKFMPTKEDIWRYVKDKMNDLQVQIEKVEKDDNVDPFFEVISKAHKGRRILQGKGLKDEHVDEEEIYVTDEHPRQLWSH